LLVLSFLLESFFSSTLSLTFSSSFFSATAVSITSWNSSSVLESSVLGLIIVSFFSFKAFLICLALIFSFQEKESLSFREEVFDKIRFTTHIMTTSISIDVRAIRTHAQNCFIYCIL
jgi:hypothetical protein